MGLRHLPRIVKRTLKLNSNYRISRLIHSCSQFKMKANSENNEYEEIRIDMPWGHVAGKWYGPQNVRPIVGLHGWQDNAGTFDTLAPLLPSHISFLSLDLPGHGLSSRLPDGIFYHGMDSLYVIRKIMIEYNWDKISLLGHSMSSILGYLFAGIYPDKIDMFIGLDALKPHVRPVNKLIDSIAHRMENFIIADERNRQKSEPPSYTYDELIEKLHIGTFQSVDKDKCKYLLARAIQKSTKFPDKYFFTRDSRLKSYNYSSVPQEGSVELAKRIRIPYCFVKATNSSYYEDVKYYYEVLEVLKENPKFEYYEIEGTHHVHLNEPQKIADIINPFINKYRPPEEAIKSKL